MLDYQELFAADTPIKAISQMPSLRPFIFAQIPSRDDFAPGATQGFVIDDARNPETEKFRFVKGMQFNVNPDPHLELTLFDDRGQVDKTLEHLYVSIEQNDDVAYEDKTFIQIQFGWSIPIIDPFEGTLVEGRISSGVHKLIISGLEISYTEGGIAYKITATNSLQATKATVQQQTTPLLEYKQALTALMTQKIHKPAMAAPMFGSGYRSPRKMVKRWEMNSLNHISTINNWSSQILSKRGQPLHVYWSSIMNCLVVDDMKTSSGLPDEFAKEIGGPHDVNFWRQNSYYDGQGTIVIKFDPKISGPQHMAAIGQIDFLSSNERVSNKTNASPESKQLSKYNSPKKGQGTQIRVPSRKADDPVTTEQQAFALEKKLSEMKRAIGSGGYFGASCVLECIGWPRADDIGQLMGKGLWLNVHDPFSSSDFTTDDRFMEWASNGLNPVLSGYWLIKGVVHLIDDTGYRMNIDCTRLSNPDESAIPPTEGASPPQNGVG